MSPVIECTGLTKTYLKGGPKALDNFTLTVNQGTCFGLIGENGAGKSTLIRLLLGFIFPTAGNLRVLGETEVQRAHSRIGYLHEQPYLELRFSGFHYLNYFAELAGLSGPDRKQKVEAVLEQVDLSAAAGERIATYSKGMLQRLSIAQTLLAEPRLLILDEPTSGLDPYSQWKVRQIVAEMRRQGKTILLCTHQLAEVELLCDAVGILHRGKLVRQGPVANLLKSQAEVEIVLEGSESAVEITRRLGLENYVTKAGNNILKITASAQDEVLRRLLVANLPIRSLNPVHRSLEEVFLQTTHHKELENRSGQS